MTDQELIKALRCCTSDSDCDRCKSECIFHKSPDPNDCIPEMGKAVADRLETLLAEVERLKAQVPKWVSAEERMPEKDGRYLCVRRIGESGMCYVTIMNGDECGFSMGHIYSDDVTHWQPLPKPLSTEGWGNDDQSQ